MVRNRVILVLVLFAAPFFQVNAQETLVAGVAQRNITPIVGYPHYRTFGTAVDDSLYVKAMVFRQGTVQWAIAVCDLLWIERDLSSEVRVSVSEKTGIPYEHIMLTATHTHTGPAYHPNIYELNEHVRKSDGTEAEMIAMHSYPSFLADQISAALVEAYRSAVPATVKSGTDTVSGLSFNRRFLMKDGKVRTNPGRGNRDIVRSVGPIDPDLDILRIEKLSDQSVLALVTNFAVHSDTYGGTAFSADYPGVLARQLALRFGPDVISFFLQGASGDLNHVDVRKDRTALNTVVIGKTLAERVAGHQPQLKPLPSARLAASSKFVYAPLQAYTDSELNWASDKNAPAKYGETGLFKMRRPMKIRSLKKLRDTEAIPPTIESEPWTLPLEVQVFALSEEVAIVGLPGEIFVELGLAIKERSPFKTTWVVELTNVHVAYVPTRAAFSQGGYETLNSRLAPGSGEMLVESAVRQLKDLKR